MPFAKHETFYIREGWLYKGLQAIAANKNIFLQDDAPETLGLGNNMVRSLRFWMQATGLATEEQDGSHKVQVPTLLGQLLQQHDPYLELDGTLWLIHYNLVCSEEQATTWYWFFNHFAPVTFTRREFIDRLGQWINTQTHKEHIRNVSEKSLLKDFDCLTKTYLPSRADRPPEDQLESPLSALELLIASSEFDEESGKQLHRYRLVSASSALVPPLVFLFVLLSRQHEERPGANQVDLNTVLREAENIGRTFNIGMLALEEMLMRLEDSYPDWRTQLVRTGGLDQLTLPNVEAEEVLRTYYEEQPWQ